VFDQHTAAEFAQRDLDAGMATMSDDPYVYHLPVMTGGVGFEGVRRFYREHFIGKWPPDTQITPVVADSGRRGARHPALTPDNRRGPSTSAASHY
jgi:carboxymethylenebutenolidase